MKDKTLYKVITNLGFKDEKIGYFSRLTEKRFKALLEEKNYIILYFDKFFKKYVVFDRSNKITDAQKDLFNNNLDYYCN